MTRPVFGYKDIRGFGQPIRYLLAYLNVDYEETRYVGDSDPNWLERDKSNLGLDFPNIPYWIDENVKLTEKQAIVKYLCRKYENSLIPIPSELWKSDMLEGVLMDTWQLLVAICYTPSGTTESHFAKNYPVKLGKMSDFIGANAFSVDNSVKYIDFLAYELCYQYRAWSPNVMKSFPNIERFMKNFEELPAIRAYQNSSKYFSGPCYSNNQKKYFI